MEEMNMSANIYSKKHPVLYVVHPLDDAPEQKRSADGLGQIHMSKSVKASLVSLRVYLILIMALALYRLADLLGLFGHHAAR
jgi:hypothetical protein